MQQRNIFNVFVILLFLVIGGVILWQSFQKKNQSVDVFTTPMDTVSDSPDKSTPTTVSDAIPVEIVEESTSMNTENSQMITVMANNFSYSPNVIRVKAGQEVTLTLKNEDGFHDLVIDEFNVTTQQIPAGQSETITFTPEEPGEYEFYCSVGNHRAMGMVGTLIVE